jgi:MYXO-CTERM domain-containing protein
MRLTDPRIAESSGLVAGVRSDRLFTHNDSGDSARFFAVGSDGRTVATYQLRGVQARDWEDIERGPRGSLWLADIGDNRSTRDLGVLVHRVQEPTGPSATVAAVSYRLRYEDGPQDAEALLLSPRTGRLLVVTKSLAGGEVYEAPAALGAGVANILRRVGHVPVPEVTAGDVSPDGSRVVLRNYTAAYEWDVAGDDIPAALRGEPSRIPLPRQPQGEGITYSRDGQALLVSSEGVGQPVYRLDRTATRAGPPQLGPVQAPPGKPRGWRPVAGAAGLLLLVALVLIRRRR